MDKKTFDMAFGFNVMRFRRIRGYTQEALGKKIGVSKNTISLWEGGLRHPDIVTIINLASALSVSAADLIRCHEKEGEGDAT